MNPESFKELHNGVYMATDPVVQISAEDVRSLAALAGNLPRKRARICAQRENDTPIHEMIIVLARETYIRPHMHTAKTESFHVIEGVCDIVLFKPDGAIREVISLGDYKSSRAFFYRIAEPVFHTLIIRSPVFIIHETTNGPFLPEGTIEAGWAPAESDATAAKSYMENLTREVDDFLRNFLTAGIAP